MKALPKVSVVMAAYNAGATVAEAIESVLHQTCADFELIAVDDGSSDDTFRILSEFGDPRIRLIRNSENVGLAYSLNAGLAAASGEFVARIDADDKTLPE